MRKSRNEKLKSAQRRLKIQELLAKYPDLSPDRVTDLVSWFEREASRAEIASVVNRPTARLKYYQLRHDQLRKGILHGSALPAVLAPVLLMAAAALIAML